MTKEELITILEYYVPASQDMDSVLSAINEYYESDPLFDFIEEIKHMQKLYANNRYSNAEEQRDKLAEKLDDIMRNIN